MTLTPFSRPVADIAPARHAWVMNALGLASIAAFLLGAPVAVAGRPVEGCDIKEVKTIGELQYLLSSRAVEVVNRAAASHGGNDPRLQQLVAPAAAFSLGAGDVGRPLGTGVAGARALAREMKADTFPFFGWDFIPTPIEDACARQKVVVDFINSRGKNVYPVTFTFEAGRVVTVAGWSRSFETGPVEPIRD
ncbi:MAG: hypothetical protein JWN66_1552 [Sphingomonas bacterium]|nr:hypothetical protein [Sphingomonas bacterium]